MDNLRKRIEDLLATQERMIAEMQQQGAEHMRAGREESAQHCISFAEGLSVSALSLRCILDGPAVVEGHRLEAVS